MGIENFTVKLITPQVCTCGVIFIEDYEEYNMFESGYFNPKDNKIESSSRRKLNKKSEELYVIKEPSIKNMQKLCDMYSDITDKYVWDHKYCRNTIDVVFKDICKKDSEDDYLLTLGFFILKYYLDDGLLKIGRFDVSKFILEKHSIKAREYAVLIEKYIFFVVYMFLLYRTIDLDLCYSNFIDLDNLNIEDVVLNFDCCFTFSGAFKSGKAHNKFKKYLKMKEIDKITSELFVSDDINKSVILANLPMIKWFLDNTLSDNPIFHGRPFYYFSLRYTEIRRMLSEYSEFRFAYIFEFMGDIKKYYDDEGEYFDFYYYKRKIGDDFFNYTISPENVCIKGKDGTLNKINYLNLGVPYIVKSGELPEYDWWRDIYSENGKPVMLWKKYIGNDSKVISFENYIKLRYDVRNYNCLSEKKIKLLRAKYKKEIYDISKTINRNELKSILFTDENEIRNKNFIKCAYNHTEQYFKLEREKNKAKNEILQEISHKYSNMQSTTLKDAAIYMIQSNDAKTRDYGFTLLVELENKEWTGMQMKFLQIIFSDDIDDLKKKITSSMKIAGDNVKAAPGMCGIRDIVNTAFKAVLLKAYFDSDSYLALCFNEKSNCFWDCKSDFIRAYLESDDILQWFSDNLCYVVLNIGNELDNIYFEIGGYMEVLIREILIELVKNIFKYGDKNKLVGMNIIWTQCLTLGTLNTIKDEGDIDEHILEGSEGTGLQKLVINILNQKFNINFNSVKNSLNSPDIQRNTDDNLFFSLVYIASEITGGKANDNI